GMGSVSQIGWEWYKHLSQKVETTLVTHIRNRETLETAGAPLPNSEIVYVDTEWFAAPLYKTAKKLFPKSEHAVFMLSSLDFFVYDYIAVKKLQELMKKGKNWDIVHAVTPVSTFAPTRLHQLGLPLVVGPLNGGLGKVAAFPEIMKAESSWLYPLRNIAILLDKVIGSTHKAAKILTATKATIDSLPDKVHSKCTQMIENGIILDRFKPTPWPSTPSEKNPLKILFVGRLIPVKGIPMLIEAVADLKKEFPVELRIAGSGAMFAQLREQVEQLGLCETVKFLGALSLDEVAEQMQQAHLFCLPSVRESGGAVLLEAMASARPVVALNFGGPSEIVDSSVGHLIEATGVEQVVKGLAETIRDLFRSPEKWKQKGLQGRQRAEQEYSWQAKIDQALKIYQEVV
ncbi:MAG: glycosyltransferase family 4 protein, partial [Blastocatellia bacterium]|nr:glycosyltransferase family 4 protein [Blastocatellia bacterium]